MLIERLRSIQEADLTVEQAMPAVRHVQERLSADRAMMVRMLGEIAQVHNEVTPAPLRVLAQR